MSLIQTIEAILFVASKPLSVRQLSTLLDIEENSIEEALEHIAAWYTHDRGIQLLRVADSVQFATHPETSEAISSFVTKDVSGELTKAQLETLTVIAYRGPVSRAEIEEIRGVNCAVILRTLLVRGLVIEHQRKEDIFPVYELSLDTLAHLGVAKVSELPEYQSFHQHAHIEAQINEQIESIK